ncbi:MAG: penicillin-binding protein 2 [Candidatus Cloacimonetes bacterium]|nr:penicillin-binding protein 2 [Candidatus Cloacimonadota bacterium]
MFSRLRIYYSSIIILTAIFIILLTILFKLQIIEGTEYTLIAEKNYVRIKTVLPLRGEIYDCRYRPIAVNKSSFNLYITLGLVKNREKLIDFIEANFASESSEIDKLLHRNRFRLHQEILLIQNVSYEKMVEISEQMNDYPSLVFKPESMRSYLYNNHFLGYVGKISENEHLQMQNRGYSINSIIGKTGLEKFYEPILKGENGYEVVQVDASGRSLEFFRHNLTKSPVDGSNLILSLDNELQQYIQSIFPEDKNGAVVIMDVRDGGIMAYVSMPEYDPNLFVGTLSSATWNELINNERNPMLDRVIHGSYPPGSVYKPVIASLGLEDSLITAQTKLADCTGGLQIGDRFFKCWFEDGHGSLSVTDAMKYSCDVFFYDLSLLISLERMKEYTRSNHLTVKTGVDLIGERNGFFPDESWYRSNFGKYVGIIGPKVNLAIGQGEILVTPLQICAYYAALANGGKWIRPHLLGKTINSKGTLLFESESKPLPISKSTSDLLDNALYVAVNEKYGTGVASSIKNFRVCGKTGSSENHMGEDTHAWFSGYASWEEPEIAFVVFLENAGHGGSVAAPLARKILLFYNQIRST